MRARLIVYTTAIVTLLLSSVPGYGEEPLVERKPVSRRKAIIMSALFPGLGQLALEHQLRGGGLLASESVSLVIAFAANTNYDTELDKYNLTKAEYLALEHGGDYYDADRKWKDLENLREELDKWQRTRRISLIAAGAVYLYNLIDIVLLTSGGGGSTPDVTRTGLRFQPVNGCPGLMLSKSF